MDCRTARLLLDFARPQARELEEEEAEALEHHLDHCPDCHSRASGERQFDESLGNAMCQVEVPADLRDRLLARLETVRGDWHRQRFAHAARLTAAAAALLLVCWSGWYWVRERMVSPIDTQQVANAVSNEAMEDPVTRTERALKDLGYKTPLTRYLDYSLLACPPAKAELPGHRGRIVAMLVFERNGRVARVYLIPEKGIPRNAPELAGGSSFKAELLPSEGEPFRFLVIHDGENLNWLLPPVPPPA